MNDTFEPTYNEIKLLQMIRKLKPFEQLNVAKNQNGSLLTISIIPKPERTTLDINSMLQ